MKIKLAELQKKWDKAKPSKTVVFWIMVVTIFATMYVGFSQAGWVTARNASRNVEDAASFAVTQRLAPICVTQFGQDSEGEVKLAELQELNSSGRRALFVKEQGWATMPGESEPDSKVAVECARQLMLIGN